MQTNIVEFVPAWKRAQAAKPTADQAWRYLSAALVLIKDKVDPHGPRGDPRGPGRAVRSD